MPKDKLAHLGNCIRAARHDCKLTQQELADDCHVAIKTIQNIELGDVYKRQELWMSYEWYKILKIVRQDTTKTNEADNLRVISQ